MKRLITKCPVCQENLKIAALKCPDCGLELRNSFDPSIFDQINDEQYTFLIAFLRNRGNLKNLQSELQLSYFTVKKKLDELLLALGIMETQDLGLDFEEIDLSQMNVDTNSSKASEVVKAKLKNAGGHVIVHTARGIPCEVVACADGETFVSDKLPNRIPFRYDVFDVVVGLLLSNGGRARKGNGRSYRLGDPECDETTVVGAIAIHYFGKKPGESVYDPVFVIAAILEWAGIVTNERGELVLTASYRSELEL